MSIETILGIVVIIAGAVLFSLSNRKANESNTLSKYVPMDNINSIPFDIPVVVNGTVIADQPLTSPATQKSCVYFRYILEREEEKKDNNGIWEWKHVGSPELQTIPFYLQDQTGKILIKPQGCEVNSIYRTQQFLQPGTIQNMSSSLNILADAFQFSNPAKGNRERVTEDTIFTGATLNVFGILTMEGDQKFFQKTNAYPLILSPLSKNQLVGSEKKNAFISYGLAIAIILIGIFLTLQR